MEGGFRCLLRKFCLESTIAGLKYFYLYPDPLSRCFWAATILSVSALGCQLSWLLYNRFTDMPTRIALENQYEPIQSLSQPAITICSPTQVTYTAIRHFNKTLVDGNTTLKLENILPKLLGFYELLPEWKVGDLVYLQKLLDVNRYRLTEVMQALPQTCEDFLKLCIFEHKLYYNCKDLFRPILTQHGLCCIFNSLYYLNDKKRNEVDPKSQRRMVRFSGVLEALTVVTDYNPDDAVIGTILNAGASRVMFTDWKEFPADDETNLVEPNIEAYHTIHATYTYCSDDVKVLPSWSRKCYFEDEHPLRFFINYHNSDCDHLCFVSAVEKYCNCLMAYVPNVHISQVCLVTSIPCVIEVKLQLGKYIQSEECDCPRDCESTQYKADMSIGNLKGLPYVVNNPYSGLIINTSTTIMHFFFANSGYVKQKQETVMSLISLASNLGGVFGLCLGFSVISVLEIIFFFYVLIRNFIRHRLSQRRVNEIEIFST